MNKTIYILPEYTQEIIASITKRDWLVHNFRMEEPKYIYNPCNYLDNKSRDGVTYTLFFDLNIYQFLINAVKKSQPHKNYRDAVGLLSFCQLAEIEIDPKYAIYERENDKESNLEEAVEDLELFQKVNNADNEELAKYALGFADIIDLKSQQEIDRDQVRKKLLRYRRSTEWDCLYLILLSIINIKIDNSIIDSNKLKAFFDWMVRDYRMSLVASIYAMVLFGKKPIKRMLKFKVNQDPVERRSAVSNMTWDLYLMNQFFRKWEKNGEQEEFLFASDDKAFVSLLNSAIAAQKQSDFAPMKSYLTDAGYEVVQEYCKRDVKREKRVYGSDRWIPEYRDQLILDLENKLSIAPSST